MIGRIQRVINNHQLSCHHTDRYFYVLRGFDSFIKNIKMPMNHDSKELNSLANRYILESELEDFDISRFEGFKIIEIVFNLFEDNHVYEDEVFKKVEQLEMNTDETIHIFNQINQLKDVSDAQLNNQERLELAHNLLKREVKK